MDFEELYQTYFKDVYLYIRRLSGSEHIAEEITSDTFFKAMRSIDQFRGDCDLRVWLCQIAKHSYYSYQKKRERLTNFEEEQINQHSSPSQSFEDKLEDHETVQHLQVLLHTLPEPYKEVFMWRVFADLSFKQIGRLFNKTENWACVTYHRARTMLKKKMEDSHET